MIGAVYTLTDIALWTGGATIIGFAGGWMVRRQLLAGRIQRRYADLHAEEERRRGELRLELEDHKAEAAGLRAALAARTNELALKGADAERAVAHADRSERAITKIEKDLTAALSEVAKLRGQKVDREATISTLRSMTEGTPVAAGNIEHELDAARAAISRLRIDAASYQTTIAALSREIQETQPSAGQVADVDKLRARVAAVTAEKRRTTLELHELRETHSQCGAINAEPDITVVVAESREPSGPGAPTNSSRSSANYGQTG